MEFPCSRCEEVFTDKLELVMHFWLAHGLALDEAQKATDREDYSRADSGCKQATDHLGYPSSCSKCSFPKCVYDKPGQRKKLRDKDIRQLYKKGLAVEVIAVLYNISVRTVERAISRKVNA